MAWTSLLVLALLAAPDAPVRVVAGGPDYAVVVSRATYTDPSWRAVVDALVEQHAATVIVHAGPVTEAREALAEVFPRHACFVAKPLEADRAYVVAVHRLTRALDDDPYGDVRWGILTGYDAADALRIAKRREPLVVRRFLAGCEFDVTCFEEALEYSELEPGRLLRRKRGGEKETLDCPADATEEFVRALAEFAPDHVMTSGHATARDWQLGYRFRSGQLRCEKGRLFGLDLEGHRFEVRSPNPKIYTCAGNCLMGLVDGRDAMALAWIHSAGVHQMIGYVVVTWYGFGGRADRDYFIAQGDRFTLAEAFFLQEQRLLHRLETEHPDAARRPIDATAYDRGPMALAEIARSTDRDAIGLLWDRDTVVLYGDPAWEARLAPQRPPAWDQTLDRDGDRYTFRVVARRAGTWGIPPMAFLPFRVKDVRVTLGAELEPLITDDFLLLPLRGEFAARDEVVLEFRAAKR